MPDRWRLGSHNPFTVYRAADGAHDVDHAREYFVTSFRREEDARLAVDAVNAQAGPYEDGLTPWATYRFDPNVRVRGVQTYTGYEDRLRGEAPRRGKTVRLVETESGMTVDGVVTETDDDKRLIYVAVDWSRLRTPDDEPAQPTTPPSCDCTPPSCDCPTTDGAVPAGSAVGQRGAPTRDGLARALSKAWAGPWPKHDGVWTDLADVALAALRNEELRGLSLDEPATSRLGDVPTTLRWVKAVIEADLSMAEGEQEADEHRALLRRIAGAQAAVDAALRDGGADAGGEDDLAIRYPGVALTRDSLRLHAEALTEDLNTALREKRDAQDGITRLSTALGVSLDPDDPDPVGRLVEAAGKAREVEVVTSKQAVALPPGSWVLRCHQNGTPWLNASPRPADAIGSAGDPRWLVLYCAPAPAAAALAVGEVVESAADLDRRASVGTIVEHKTGATRRKHGDGDRGIAWEPFLGEHNFPVTIVRVGTGGGES